MAIKHYRVKRGPTIEFFHKALRSISKFHERVDFFCKEINETLLDISRVGSSTITYRYYYSNPDLKRDSFVIISDEDARKVGIIKEGLEEHLNITLEELDLSQKPSLS